VRRSLHVLASLSLVACVSKSDYDASKAALSQTQAQLAQCQNEANAERGAATMKLAETQMALRESKAVEQRLLAELRQAKGSVDGPTTTPALPSYPVVDALAQLLKPKAKHLKKEVDTEPGESYWVVDDGTVPNGTVMLSRLKADPTAWSFSIAYLGDPAIALTIRDFGNAELLCTGYYRITTGPLLSALIWDQGRGNFFVQTGSYNKRAHLAGWQCEGKVLE